MNTSFRIAIILIMLFAIIAPRCAHAMSDFAGQGKAPITWDELMQPRVDPARYFATPGGGHGNHPAGGYDEPSRPEVSRPDSSSNKPIPDTSSDDQTVKPDIKPPMPHIPLVPAPKPQPEVKPEVKPTPPSIPTVKPPKDEPVKPECKPHKCWPFKFRAPKAKPTCKHAHDKPACKPDHLGATPSNLGKGLCGKFGGHKMSGHSKGKCGRGGHGKGRR